jgi:hypothetical protein
MMQEQQGTSLRILISYSNEPIYIHIFIASLANGMIPPLWKKVTLQSERNNGFCECSGLGIGMLGVLCDLLYK